MTDYTELVKALRYCVNARNCKKCGYRINNNSVKCRIKRVEDAADAIEELQDKVFELEEELNDADIAADDNGRQVEKLAKRNAELHSEVEKWVSAAEQAGEPKRGKWIRVEDADSFHYECSRCGERPLYSRYGDIVLSGVCPMCGAKMEVQE